jgi:outer membrane murein-binding lipoprotein Lpp
MEQDEKIEQLAKAIKQLDAKVSQVTESEDYLEEK